jgi:hypothetical protein
LAPCLYVRFWLKSREHEGQTGLVTNETFSRVKVDALLKDVGWQLTDGRSVRFRIVAAISVA